MKRKILCLVVALTMVFAAVPTVFAADETVATIDGKAYTSLQSAVNKVKDGETIVLQKDQEKNGDSTVVVKDKDGISFTIDLNGKTFDKAYNGFLDIQEVGKLTITNGTLTSSSADKAIIEVNSGMLILDNVTINQNDESLDAVYNRCGTVIAKSCTISVVNPSTYPIFTATENGAETRLHSCSKEVPSGPETYMVVYRPAASIGGKDFATIQAAVDVVEDGDTILLENDQYPIDSINLDGKDGIAFTLDLNEKKVDVQRSFLNVNKSVTLTIKNGTIRSGSPDDNAINISAGTLILDRVDMDQTDNTTYAIENNGGTVILKTANVKSSDGGSVTKAINHQSGVTKLDNNSISDTENWVEAKKFSVYRNTSKMSIAVSTKQYVYNGKAKKPAITLKDGGVTLKNGTDYTVAYKNNIKTGTATATVTGKGWYSGTKSVTYRIIPAKAVISKLTPQTKAFTAYIKSQKTAGVTGYQIAYKKGTNGKYKYVYTTSTTKKISKLSKKATYYVKVRAYKTIAGKKYFGAYSSAKRVKTK